MNPILILGLCLRQWRITLLFMLLVPMALLALALAGAGDNGMLVLMVLLGIYGATLLDHCYADTTRFFPIVPMTVPVWLVMVGALVVGAIGLAIITQLTSLALPPPDAATFRRTALLLAALFGLQAPWIMFLARIALRSEAHDVPVLILRGLFLAVLVTAIVFGALLLLQMSISQGWVAQLIAMARGPEAEPLSIQNSPALDLVNGAPAVLVAVWVSTCSLAQALDLGPRSL